MLIGRLISPASFVVATLGSRPCYGIMSEAIRSFPGHTPSAESGQNTDIAGGDQSCARLSGRGKPGHVDAQVC